VQVPQAEKAMVRDGQLKEENRTARRMPTGATICFLLVASSCAAKTALSIEDRHPVRDEKEASDLTGPGLYWKECDWNPVTQSYDRNCRSGYASADGAAIDCGLPLPPSADGGRD
jgi:hypothetical protein